MDSAFVFPGPPSMVGVGRTGFILAKPDPQQPWAGSSLVVTPSSLPCLLKCSGGGIPRRENVPA